MKRIISAAAAVVLLLMSLVSCGPEPLGMYPVYVGEEVTSPKHEFSQEDFYVIIAFDDGTDRAVDDFEFEIVERAGGNFVIDIIYEDISYPVIVPINVAVYPSELGETVE